jgi:hypothetical protein
VSTTDNPAFTVDETQISRIRAELADSLNAQQATRRRTMLFVIACPLGIVGCVSVVSWLLSGRILSNVGGGIAFGVLFLLICSPLCLFAVSLANEECAKAEWKLKALDVEVAQTTRALELAHSGSPFVLFLRSFRAELTGLDSAGEELGSFNRGLERSRALRMGEPYVEDLDHIVAHRKMVGSVGGLAVNPTALPNCAPGQHQAR